MLPGFVLDLTMFIMMMMGLGFRVCVEWILIMFMSRIMDGIKKMRLSAHRFVVVVDCSSQIPRRDDSYWLGPVRDGN